MIKSPWTIVSALFLLLAFPANLAADSSTPFTVQAITSFASGPTVNVVPGDLLWIKAKKVGSGWSLNSGVTLNGPEGNPIYDPHVTGYPVDELGTGSALIGQFYNGAVPLGGTFVVRKSLLKFVPANATLVRFGCNDDQGALLDNTGSCTGKVNSFTAGTFLNQLAKVIGVDTGLGDPISAFTGDFSMSVVDMRVPGRGMDFVLRRNYSSQMEFSDACGAGWLINYEERLIYDAIGDKFILISQSRSDTYILNATTSLYESPQYYDELEFDVPNAEIIRTMPDGTKKYYYDQSNDDLQGLWGRLKRITDRFDNTISISHIENGYLETVTDTYGRDFAFAYEEGKLATVTDFMGREVRYEYYPAGDPDGNEDDLKSVRSPLVTGTSIGNDFPLGKTTVYTYITGNDDITDHNLLTITDPKTQTYLTNVYETNPASYAFDRVIRQTYGNGDFDYHYEEINPPVGGEVQRTTMVDRKGFVTELWFNANGNVSRTYQHTGVALVRPVVVAATDIDHSAKLRSTDPDFYTSTTGHTADGLNLTTVLPRMNEIRQLRDDANTDRSAQPNVTSSSRHRALYLLGVLTSWLLQWFMNLHISYWTQ